jgi:cysteinyl-tRNA synthetase
MDERLERIFNSLGLIHEFLEEEKAPKADEDFRKKTDELMASFYRHMDDDFKTPEAIAALFSLLRHANSHISAEKPDREQLKKIASSVAEILWIFGLKEIRCGLEEKTEDVYALLKELGVKEKLGSIDEALQLLIDMREKARVAKDYKKSDMIRAKLREMGIILEDKAEGTRWKIA